MAIQAVAQAQALARHRDLHVPGTGTDFRIAQGCQQMAEGVAGPLVIGVGEHQDFAAAVGDTGIEGGGLALARQVEHGDARVDHLACAGHRVVGGAVAGEDDSQ
nr:hypothetical protein GCM10020185_62000 [Pseudomonas brassicacearum subsp. brassicacearum]